MTRLLDENRRWLVLGTLFLAAGVNVGSSNYAFGLFVEPLEEAFGWSRTAISASLSFTAVGSLASPIIGRLMDRHGARPLLVISLLLMGIKLPGPPGHDRALALVRPELPAIHRHLRHHRSAGRAA